MTAEQTAGAEPKPKPKRRSSTSRTKKTDGDGSVVKFPVRHPPIPGFPGILLDLDERGCLVKNGGVWLDWAPRLLAWWTDAEGVPVYRVQVKEQTEDVIPETLKDGTAWDRFDHAAGHDVRTIREALASAVKMQRRTLPKTPGLATLGWHEIDGVSVYVTPGTCFGPVGEVLVNLHAYSADRAALPSAPTGDQLREVVALSLSILDAAVLRVSAPAMCSAWLAPMISMFGDDVPRYVPWMWSDGRSEVYGVFKSTLAAVLQAHSGVGYRTDLDLVPVAGATVAGLAAVLGVLKDCLVILDDYKPGEASAVSAQMQTLLEQAIRMATNRQARIKMQHKSPGLAKTQACMALMMVTAECLPLFDSGSTHDRTFPFQVHPGDIDSDRLQVLRDRVGEFPNAGAGYVAWLAAHHADVTEYLKQRFRALRTELRNGEQVTGRACVHIAHMLSAAEVYTRFAVEVGALEAGRRAALLEEIRAALILAASDAVTERAEDKPADVWLSALRAEFAAGRLCAEANTGGRPSLYADALGWGPPTLAGDFPKGRTKAGYATTDGLALIEGAANAAVMELAKKSGKTLPISGVQLRRALASVGVIRRYEHSDGKHEHLRKVRAGSSLSWCPIIPWEIFLGEDTAEPPTPDRTPDTPPAPPSAEPIPAPAAEVGPCEQCRRPGEWCAQGGVTDERLPCVCGCATPTLVRSACGAPRLAHATSGVQKPAETPTTPAAPATPAQPRTSTRKSNRTARRDAALADAKAILDSSSDLDELLGKLRFEHVLEKTHAPMRRGDDGRMHAPYWRPELPPISDIVRVTTGYKWSRKYKGDTVKLDKSGAWVASAASVMIPHGAYEHTGEVEFEGKPGYYQITAYPWTEKGMPHPLGTFYDFAPGSVGAKNELGGLVWVPAPMVALLAELVDAGRWPDVAISDSYTSPGARLNQGGWVTFINELRAYTIEKYGRGVQYEAVKRNFGQAMSLMLGATRPDDTGKMRKQWKCGAHRPDWVHASQTHASAMLWRRADQCRQVAPKLGPVSLCERDVLILPADALEIVTTTALPGYDNPPIILDQTGINLRTFKVQTEGDEAAEAQS